MDLAESDDNIQYAIREIDANFLFDNDDYDEDDDQLNVLSVSSLIEDILCEVGADEDNNKLLSTSGMQLTSEDVPSCDDKYLHEIRTLKTELKKSQMNYANLVDSLNCEKISNAQLKKTIVGLQDNNDELKHEIRSLNVKLNNFAHTNESLNRDMNGLVQARLKLHSESKRYRYEYEELKAEYTQVMSERDCVHKEIEALQEQLCKEKDRFKSQLNNNKDDLGATRVELENLKNDNEALLQEVCHSVSRGVDSKL
jgi:chromosome segregation ATPase